MTPISRLIQKITLFEETGNKEFLREAKAIAYAIRETLNERHVYEKPIEHPYGQRERD